MHQAGEPPAKALDAPHLAQGAYGLAVDARFGCIDVVAYCGSVTATLRIKNYLRGAGYKSLQIIEFLKNDSNQKERSEVPILKIGAKNCGWIADIGARPFYKSVVSPARSRKVLSSVDGGVFGTLQLPQHDQLALRIAGDVGRTGIAIAVFNLGGLAPASAGHHAVGHDARALPLLVLPHHHSVALAVKADLGRMGLNGVGGIDPLRFAPACAHRIAVGCDAGMLAVRLLPHRHRIALAVQCHARVVSAASVIGLDQLRHAPAPAWCLTVGPNVVTLAIKLLPHRQCVALRVYRLMVVKRTPFVVLRQQGRFLPCARQCRGCRVARLAASGEHRDAQQ